MYSASVTKLPYLYYVQEQLNKKPFLQLQPTNIFQKSNDFKGGYEPEGSGSLSKTPDGKEYSVQELVDKIAKESDNVGHNILNYYVTHQSDQDFQKLWIKLQRNIGMLKKEKHPLKWLAMSWRLSINKMALLLMHSPLQNMMINGLRVTFQ